jgi:hypothetical protein
MKLGLPVQWRIGGVLLLVGGALSVIGAAIFAFGPEQFGSFVTVAAVFLEGAGLITVSFAFGAERVPVWARRLLFACGILLLIGLVVTLASGIDRLVLATVSAILFVVLAAALLIASIAIFRGVHAGRPVRWALLPAALFEAADAILVLTGHGAQWWTLAGIGALYVLAGVVFSSYRVHPVIAAA